nr:hypothetical protein [Nostoc sp. UIC 10630]
MICRKQQGGRSMNELGFRSSKPNGRALVYMELAKACSERLPQPSLPQSIA